MPEHKLSKDTTVTQLELLFFRMTQDAHHRAALIMMLIMKVKVTLISKMDILYQVSVLMLISNHPFPIWLNLRLSLITQTGFQVNQKISLEDIQYQVGVWTEKSKVVLRTSRLQNKLLERDGNGIQRNTLTHLDTIQLPHIILKQAPLRMILRHHKRIKETLKRLSVPPWNFLEQ